MTTSMPREPFLLDRYGRGALARGSRSKHRPVRNGWDRAGSPVTGLPHVECATIRVVEGYESSPRQITAVLFPGSELLDVFGPLEIFGVLKDQFRLALDRP